MTAPQNATQGAKTLHPSSQTAGALSPGNVPAFLARTIILPWPPSKTSANGSQGDYQGKARAAKNYKATCMIECKRQGVTPLKGVKGDQHIAVTITFCPPSNHRIDWDNISNRAKQGWDAVAEAIGVDDGRWWPVTLRKGEKAKGGLVLIKIEGAE